MNPTGGGLLGTIAAIIVALFTGGGLFQLATIRSQRRSLDTDSLRKVADATIVLLDPMRAEIERLELRVSRLTDTAATATTQYEEAAARVRLLTQRQQEQTANYDRARALLKQHNIAFPWDPIV